VQGLLDRTCEWCSMGHLLRTWQTGEVTQHARHSSSSIQASRCKRCDGTGVCEHDRLRFQCLKCDSSVKCEHDTYKHRCKECWAEAKSAFQKRGRKAKKSQWKGPVSVCQEHGQQYCVRCKFPHSRFIESKHCPIETNAAEQ